MPDPKYLELMHQRLDGELQPDDAEALDAYLASNAEANTYFQELQRVTAALDAVEEVEPEPHLPKVIMNSLPAPEKPRSAQAQGIFAALWQQFHSSRSLVFAGGVLGGLLLFALLGRGLETMPPVETSQITGTMTEIAAPGPTSVVSRNLVADGVQGTLQLQRFDGRSELAIDVQSMDRVSVLVSFVPTRATISEIGFADGLPDGEALYDESSVRFFVTGLQRLRIRFRHLAATPPPVVVRLMRNDDTLQLETLN